MQLEGHTMLEELKEKVYRANLALVDFIKHKGAKATKRRVYLWTKA